MIIFVQKKRKNFLFFLFSRAKAKNGENRKQTVGDYEEIQEDYEKRLERQKFRQRQIREAETPEQHKLRINKQLLRQKNLKENETSEKKTMRKRDHADYKAYCRGKESNDDWNKRLDLQKERQQKWRDSLEGEEKRKFQDKDALRKKEERENEPKDKKELRKEKDNAAKKEKRNVKRAQFFKSLTQAELEYQKQERWQRLQPLEKAGSFIAYLLTKVRANLEENGDWDWIYNTITNNVIKASAFEPLCKKYAIIFTQLGIVKGDVVHFCLNINTQNYVHVALCGLWMIGAIGSFGNFRKWTETSEKYSSKWAKFEHKHVSELKIHPYQLRLKSTTAIICSFDTVKHVKEILESCRDTLKKRVMLLSFEEIDGIKNISSDLQNINESKAPKPLRAHLRNDNCLFIWRRFEKSTGNPDVTEKNNIHLFFQTKEQWRRKRNEDVFTLWDFPFQGDECLPKAIMAEKIFAPFAAIEGRRLVEFENDPQEDMEEENEKSALKYTDAGNICYIETSCHPAKDFSNSIPPFEATRKPYDFSRPKITFTMEDLENSDEDNDTYEKITNIAQCSNRCQPSRTCKINQSNETDPDEESNDESMEESEFTEYVNNAVNKVLSSDINSNNQKTPDGSFQNSLVSNSKEVSNLCKVLFNGQDESGLNNHITYSLLRMLINVFDQ